MKTKLIFGIILLAFCSFLFGDALVNGESLVFDIKYGVITAGSASLNSVKTEYKGQEAWKFYSIAVTNTFFDKMYKVRDYIESMATYDNLYSFRFTKKLQEGSYRQHRIHTNNLTDGLSVYSNFNFKKNAFTDTELEIPTTTYDILSAMYKTRTLDLTPGQKVELNVTVDGKSYNAIVHVLRRETIKTILGNKTNCLVIEPVLQGESLFKQTGNIHIWITDDAKKIPVLLQSKVIFGSFKAVLTEITKARDG
jgi:hypothetical protein